jgi:hypothetical protein
VVRLEMDVNVSCTELYSGCRYKGHNAWYTFHSFICSRVTKLLQCNQYILCKGNIIAMFRIVKLL